MRRSAGKMPTLPETGLLPRRIVRTHEPSGAHAEWRWRSGVVLEWVGARALVRLDRNERRTEVAVTGDRAEDCHADLRCLARRRWGAAPLEIWVEVR